MMPRVLFVSIVLTASHGFLVPIPARAEEPTPIYFGSDGEITEYVEPLRLGPAYVETYGFMRGGITFTVEYLDVTNNNNIGFDHPAQGPTRRATFDAVLAYINSTLAHVGGMQIQVQPSQSDGTGALASAGPFVSLVVNCQQVFPFRHITTGVDPSGSVPDAQMTVDFGYAWNDDLGAPAGGEADLFSVLLHEVTHALGFTSFIVNSAGAGLGNPVPIDPGTRAAGFSGFIQNGNGLTLINCTNGDYVGTNADLVGTNNGLKHVGPATVAAWQALGNTGSAPLYAPASFQPGSSTSHWNTNVPTNCVMRNAIVLGTQVREYSTLDLAALDDLGYTLAAPADCAADIDGDLDVDMADSSAFVNVLLGTPLHPSHVVPSDLNASGAANAADVQLFVNALLAGCP